MTDSPPSYVIEELAESFTSFRAQVLHAHIELARIGRLFRDYWQPDIIAVMTEAAVNAAQDPPLPPPAAYLNYRNSGRSAPAWVELSGGLWRIHNLLDDEAPTDPNHDASQFTTDCANVCTHWLDGGEPSGEIINRDSYNLCKILSRLAHQVYHAVLAYRYKLKTYIDNLSNDQAKESVTHRTRKQWQDMEASLYAWSIAMFGELTDEGWGYSEGVLSF